MATVLTKLLAGLTPPPVINPVEYDGLEYKWKMFVFRPALFKNEVYFLAAILFYVAFAFYGMSANSKRAQTWLGAHLPLLRQQFSRPLGRTGLTKDGYTDFYNFSTGRRNVASLHTIFTLRPRHDFFQRVFQQGRGLVDLYYRPKDDIQLDFTLSSGALAYDFVWAIVAKDELLSIRDERWDLTFTKTSESSLLPQTLVVMSEYADVTDSLLKPAVINAVSDPKVLPYFRSLTVTDQPRVRPTGPPSPEERQKHVILSLSAPSPSHAGDTLQLVSAVFSLIDTLSQVNLRPETKTKLKKTREELEKELRADAEREKKEELTQAVEDKKAAKRRAEEERVAKLSAAEQQKVLEKERKRTIRKSQGKAIVRK